MRRGEATYRSAKSGREIKSHSTLVRVGCACPDGPSAGSDVLGGEGGLRRVVKAQDRGVRVGGLDAHTSRNIHEKSRREKKKKELLFSTQEPTRDKKTGDRNKRTLTHAGRVPLRAGALQRILVRERQGLDERQHLVLRLLPLRCALRAVRHVVQRR